MRKTFKEHILTTLHHEGGYVNDPHDPGGETNFGISKRAYPKLDIKNLTEEEAIEIYKRDYWDNNKVGKLPEDLRGIYFDMCVNFGSRGAAKVLQRAANSKNRGKNQIEIDGQVGPKTLKAVKKVEPDRLRGERTLHFARIVIRNPLKFKRYWFGWFRRAIAE